MTIPAPDATPPPALPPQGMAPLLEAVGLRVDRGGRTAFADPAQDVPQSHVEAP